MKQTLFSLHCLVYVSPKKMSMTTRHWCSVRASGTQHAARSMHWHVQAGCVASAVTTLCKRSMQTTGCRNSKTHSPAKQRCACASPPAPLLEVPDSLRCDQQPGPPPEMGVLNPLRDPEVLRPHPAKQDAIRTGVYMQQQLRQHIGVATYSGACSFAAILAEPEIGKTGTHGLLENWFRREVPHLS